MLKQWENNYQEQVMPSEAKEEVVVKEKETPKRETNLI